MSSSHKQHSFAVEPQVSSDATPSILEFNAEPVVYGKDLVFLPVTSSEIWDDRSAISMPNTADEKLLTDDLCQNSRLQLEEQILGLHNQEYIGNLKELQNYFDMVKKIVRPGCSEEVLNVALSSLSSLAKVLSDMSSKIKPNSCL